MLYGFTGINRYLKREVGIPTFQKTHYNEIYIFNLIKREFQHTESKKCTAISRLFT